MRSVVPFEAGHAGMKQWLGGKGANLAEMTKVGLPVPPDLQLLPKCAERIMPQADSFPRGLWTR